MVSPEKLDLSKAITFVAKIAKAGKDARIITVPKHYWENDIINDKKTYQVILIEVGKKEKKE